MTVLYRTCLVIANAIINCYFNSEHFSICTWLQLQILQHLYYHTAPHKKKVVYQVIPQNYWVPGHAAVRGNKIADKLAKGQFCSAVCWT